MRRLLNLLLPLIASLLVASCGGSSSGGPLSGGGGTSAANTTAVFDPKNADALARLALLTVQDLGGDWKIADNDFSDDSVRDRIKACSDAAALAAEEAKVRAGRALRVLSRAVPNSVSFRVSSLVEIYAEEAQAKAFFEKERAVETSPAGLACYEAIFKAGAPSFKLNVVKGTPVASAGPGARDFAIDDDVDTGTTKQLVHLELHHWLQGNAIVTLVASGSAQSVTVEAMTAALAKQRDVAVAAATGKR